MSIQNNKKNKMKNLQIAVLVLAICTLFAACQSTSAQKNTLSNTQSRSEIMQEIANDSTMSNEMIEAMMNNKNGMMMMQQHQMMMMGNQSSMMNMLKNNPGMIQSMLSGIMETANGDSSMMSGMYNIMKDNPQMMQMMHNNTGNGMMNGKKPMMGMGH